MMERELDPHEGWQTSDGGEPLYLVEVFDNLHTNINGGDVFAGAWTKEHDGYLEVKSDKDYTLALYAPGHWRKVNRLPDTEYFRQFVGKEANPSG